MFSDRCGTMLVRPLRSKHDVANHPLTHTEMKKSKQEAPRESLFVIGWRPAVHWVCVISIWLNYAIIPFLAFVLSAEVELTPEGHQAMRYVVFLYVWLMILRTLEKRAGVARASLYPADVIARLTLSIVRIF